MNNSDIPNQYEPDYMAETFGKLLSGIIAKKGYKQQWVADQGGVTKDALSRWINDKQTPRLSSIAGIGKALNLQFEQLEDETWVAYEVTQDYYEQMKEARRSLREHQREALGRLSQHQVQDSAVAMLKSVRSMIDVYLDAIEKKDN